MKDNEMGTPESVSAGTVLRGLSASDWASFGLQDIAYVRPARVNGVVAFAIHAADGRPIGAAPSAELAMAAIREHEMQPAYVH